jgi:hypothetical protein
MEKESESGSAFVDEAVSVTVLVPEVEGAVTTQDWDAL